MAVIVGTSGYSYKDWVGPYYPAGTRPDAMLGLYAGEFRAVELNFSYYGLPKAATLEKMAMRVDDGFKFTLKLHKDLTHERDRARESMPAFREALRPLTESGKLGGLLAQFPNSFQGTRENCRHLLWLAEELQGCGLAVEFRHDSWDREDIPAWLARHGIALCSVDLPRLQGLPAPVARLADPGMAYLRFHGRNAASWYRHEESYQRYQYVYSGPELAEWVPRVKELAGQAAAVYVFFNNHFGGQAAVDARAFRLLLAAAGIL